MKKLILFLLLSISCTYAKAASITVTGIERNSKTSILIRWTLADDSGNFVESGSMSLQFVGLGDINPDTGNPYTRQERVLRIRDQFVDFAAAYIKRYKTGEADFDAHAQQFIGFTVTR